MTRTALFPGVFDPLTLGHLDIIKRTPIVCEKLIVAVAQNPAKTTFCTVEERLDMLRAATHDCLHVEITAFSGLAVEYAKERNVAFLVRGVRGCSDFEYEFQMAAANRRMSGLETVVFMSQHSYISSSLIREIAHFGGPLQNLVPAEVESFLRKKFSAH